MKHDVTDTNPYGSHEGGPWGGGHLDYPSEASQCPVLSERLLLVHHSVGKRQEVRTVRPNVEAHVCRQAPSSDTVRQEL